MHLCSTSIIKITSRFCQKGTFLWTYPVKRKLFTEFSNCGWALSGLRKPNQTGSIGRKSGSGRPRSAWTNENIDYVEKEILRQETNPAWHSTLAEVSKRLGISESSVRRIVKNDLKLKLFKQMKGQVLSPPEKQKRIVRARKLLKQLTVNKLNISFFSDEKVCKSSRLQKFTELSCLCSLW